MADMGDLIHQFAEVTGCQDQSRARFFLEAANLDLQVRAGAASGGCQAAYLPFPRRADGHRELPVGRR